MTEISGGNSYDIDVATLAGQVARLEEANKLLWATQAIARVRPSAVEGAQRFQRIKAIVRDACRLSDADLASGARYANIVLARQIIAYLAAKLTGLNGCEISRLLSCDHSTTIHSIKKMEMRRAADLNFAKALELLAEAVGDDGEHVEAPSPVGILKEPRPLLGKRGCPEEVKRNAEIAQRYLTGETSTMLAPAYGLSRERICQILRRENVISTVAERRRLAKDALAEESAEIKSRAKAARRERIEAAVELVTAGESHRQAAAKAGLPFCELKLLHDECRRQNIKSLHGRWRGFDERKARVRELHASGCTQVKAIETLRAGGDPVYEGWIKAHMPELAWRKSRRPTAPLLVGDATVRTSEPPLQPDVWTPERTKKLCELWLAGSSARQIVDIFGEPFTRNMIIGKVGRLRADGQLKIAA